MSVSLWRLIAIEMRKGMYVMPNFMTMPMLCVPVCMRNEQKPFKVKNFVAFFLCVIIWMQKFRINVINKITRHKFAVITIKRQPTQPLKSEYFDKINVI